MCTISPVPGNGRFWGNQDPIFFYLPGIVKVFLSGASHLITDRATFLQRRQVQDLMTEVRRLGAILGQKQRAE